MGRSRDTPARQDHRLRRQHTATHGAFGALATPIGTTQIELVLSSQCLAQARPKTMEIRVDGALPMGVTAKDLILGVIGRIGVDGGIGHVIEYTGEAIRSLSMEGRMTVCNMSIEAGARSGMIAPDETTFEYMRGRPYAPQGDEFDAAVERWKTLPSDPGATYDKVVEIDAGSLVPFVTWGTNPGMVAPVTGRVPDPASLASDRERAAAERALVYMGLEPDTSIQDIWLNNVFIGSCTNSRIEDLRSAAAVVKGTQGASGRVRYGCARLHRDQEAGGGGGARPHLQGRGPGLARGGLLHVPGHEPGHPPAGAAVRIHLQPQLRGSAGAGGPHPPGEPRRWRRRRP